MRTRNLGNDTAGRHQVGAIGLGLMTMSQDGEPPRQQLLDTVTADQTHRGHAVIEQVHADLKNSALAHLPSGVFNANAAWLVLAILAFNLTRAAATLTD